MTASRVHALLPVCAFMLLFVSCVGVPDGRIPYGSDSSVLRESRTQALSVLKFNPIRLDTRFFRSLGFSAPAAGHFSDLFVDAVSYLADSGTVFIGRTGDISDGNYHAAGKHVHAGPPDAATDTIGFLAEFKNRKLVRVDLSNDAIITFFREDPHGHQVTFYNSDQSRTIMEVYTSNELLGYKLTLNDITSVVIPYGTDHVIDPAYREQLVSPTDPENGDHAAFIVGSNESGFSVSDTARKRTVCFSTRGNGLFSPIEDLENIDPSSFREYAEFKLIDCIVPDYHHANAFRLSYMWPLRKKTTYKAVTGTQTMNVTEYADFFGARAAKKEEIVDPNETVSLVRYTGSEQAIIYHELMDQDKIDELKLKYRAPSGVRLLLSIEEKKRKNGPTEYDFLAVTAD